jgi:hypothetical protein
MFLSHLLLWRTVPTAFLGLLSPFPGEVLAKTAPSEPPPRPPTARERSALTAYFIAAATLLIETSRRTVQSYEVKVVARRFVVRLIGDELNLRCAGILAIYWSGILEKPQVAIDRKSQQCIDACKRATPCSKYVVARSQGVSFRCQASRRKGLDLAARSGGT